MLGSPWPSIIRNWNRGTLTTTTSFDGGLSSGLNSLRRSSFFIARSPRWEWDGGREAGGRSSDRGPVSWLAREVVPKPAHPGDLPAGQGEAIAEHCIDEVREGRLEAALSLQLFRPILEAERGTGRERGGSGQTRWPAGWTAPTGRTAEFGPGSPGPTRRRGERRRHHGSSDCRSPWRGRLSREYGVPSSDPVAQVSSAGSRSRRTPTRSTRASRRCSISCSIS